MLATIIIAVAIAAPAPDHPIAFWRQIAQDKFAVPAGSDLAALTSELTGMLASPDPERRDEIAYSTLAAWIYQTRAIGDDALRPIIDRLLGNLTDGVGERGTARIFKRSFSALTLAAVVARDNAAPFLREDEFHRVERAALDYLQAERDLRGYDPETGWMHSAAHTADLLKFIGRSRHVDTQGQARLLEAISRKLAVPEVFTHGEDERFARAVLSIVNRADFDRAGFAAWSAHAAPPRPGERPTAAELSAAQNAKNLLAKLLVLLDAAPQPSDGVRAAHDNVRAALKDLF
jgi:hypothetical protein